MRRRRAGHPRTIPLLQQQNKQLQDQLRKQQELIDSLTHKVSEIQDLNAKRDGVLTGLKAEIKAGNEEPPPANKALPFGKVNLSGEGGVAFFHSQSKGQTPNAEFRIDEARVFLEGPVWQDVYFFTELNLATRELTDLNLRVGELYLDFENVSQLWHRDRMLNLRAAVLHSLRRRVPRTVSRSIIR